MDSPYETLGVEIDASAEAIKRAWRRACKEHHPDREGGDTTKMAAANWAYELLSDPERRAHYDAHGEDTKAAEPEDAHARVIIRNILTRTLVNPDRNLDFYLSVRDSIIFNMKTFAGQEAAALSDIQMIQRRRSEFRVKKSTEFINDAFDQVLSEYQEAYEERKLFHSYAKRALSMFDELVATRTTSWPFAQVDGPSAPQLTRRGPGGGYLPP